MNLDGVDRSLALLCVPLNIRSSRGTRVAMFDPLKHSQFPALAHGDSGHARQDTPCSTFSSLAHRRDSLSLVCEAHATVTR